MSTSLLTISAEHDQFSRFLAMLLLITGPPASLCDITPKRTGFPEDVKNYASSGIPVVIHTGPAPNPVHLS